MPSRQETKELRRKRKLEDNEIAFRRRMEISGKILEAMRSPGIGTITTFIGIKGMNKVGLVNDAEAVGLQLVASMGTIGPQGPLGVAAVAVATLLQGVDLTSILGPNAQLIKTGTGVIKTGAGVVTGNVEIPGPLQLAAQGLDLIPRVPASNLSDPGGILRGKTALPGPIDLFLGAFSKLKNIP